jgi:hypothetical protein
VLGEVVLDELDLGVVADELARTAAADEAQRVEAERLRVRDANAWRTPPAANACPLLVTCRRLASSGRSDGEARRRSCPRLAPCR